MGLCQSQREDDAIHASGAQIGKDASKSTGRPQKTKTLRIETAHNETKSLDIFSPANTTTTHPETPGSPLTSPHSFSGGSLNLVSIISTTPTASVPEPSHQENFTSESEDHAKVDLNPPDVDAPSDEDTFYTVRCSKRSQSENVQNEDRQIEGCGPEQVILNPPLVAPPPGEAEFLSKCKTGETSDSRMFREFKKLKIQADRTTLSKKEKRKAVKVENRREEVREYRSLWNEFGQIQKSVKTKELIRKFEDMNEKNAARQRQSRAQVEVEKTNRPPRSKSLDAKRSSTWFLNFNSSTDETFDDKENRDMEFNMLSEASRDAQRLLILQKNDNTLTEQLHRNDSSQEMKSAADHDSYFKKLTAANTGTPNISPPRLQLNTEEKARDPPRRTRTYSGTSLTNMELQIVHRDERAAHSHFGDDTSGITDADFNYDYRVPRRSTRARILDETSVSGYSMGSTRTDLPSNVSHHSRLRNLPFPRDSRSKSVNVSFDEHSLKSVGISTSSQLERNSHSKTPVVSTSFGDFSLGVSSNSLEARIASLEKRMGIVGAVEGGHGIPEVDEDTPSSSQKSVHSKPASTESDRKRTDVSSEVLAESFRRSSEEGVEFQTSRRISSSERYKFDVTLNQSARSISCSTRETRAATGVSKLQPSKLFLSEASEETILKGNLAQEMRRESFGWRNTIESDKENEKKSVTSGVNTAVTRRKSSSSTSDGSYTYMSKDEFLQVAEAARLEEMKAPKPKEALPVAYMSTEEFLRIAEVTRMKESSFNAQMLPGRGEWPTDSSYEEDSDEEDFYSRQLALGVDPLLGVL